MKIVCSSSVLLGEEAFSTLGDVVVIREQQINNETLKDADVLIARSGIRINRDLMEGTSVGFAGSPVSGTDHIDAEYLNEMAIAWCAASGCNANSVSEYVISALLYLTHRHGLILSGKTLGVIGVGNIGERVAQKAEALNMNVLKNDPPRKAATGDERFVSLRETLEGSDIVTLHVPLSTVEPYATYRMADYGFFEKIKPGALFINTSRGDVVDSDALQLAMDRGVILQAALDVWENEPVISKKLLDIVDIGTPHIAGYSYEGKLNGTRMVYRELCNYLEVKPVWEPPQSRTGNTLEIDALGGTDEEVLWEVVRMAYDVDADSRCFKAGASSIPLSMGEQFIQYRRNYPYRKGFADQPVKMINAEKALADKTAGLGFQVYRR